MRGEHPPTQLHKPEPKLDEDSRRQELRASFTHKHVNQSFNYNVRKLNVAEPSWSYCWSNLNKKYSYKSSQ